MRVGPSVPVQLDLSTGSNLERGLTRCGGQVADDIVSRVGVRGNEPVDQVLRVGPTSYDWLRVLVLEGRVVAIVVDAVDSDALDESVCSGSRCEGNSQYGNT